MSESKWGNDIFPALSWFKKSKMEKASVMVVGCGALGNEVLKNLALFGVGHIVIVDYDTVEYSNLTRSVLFTAEDASGGVLKVDAAKRSIQNINPYIKVDTINGNICYNVGLGVIREMDVVVGCLDNKWARYCLNRLCIRADVPWVDGGINALEGVAKVFIPGQNCYACTLASDSVQQLTRKMSCSNAIKRDVAAQRVPTTPVVASVIGAVQAQEAIKLIHRSEIENGELTSLCGKMFYYDGQHLGCRVIEHRGWDDDCPVHQKWMPVIKSGIGEDDTVGEALQTLASLLDSTDVTIVLRNHLFVDYIEHKVSGERINVMLPDYKVADFIEENEKFRYCTLGMFYENEYKSIDGTFEYKQLTLKQIGIPAADVLEVLSGNNTYYVEMKTV